MSEAKQIPPKLMRLLRNAPAMYFAFLLILTALAGWCYFYDYDFVVSSPTVWFLVGLVPQAFFTGLCLFRFREHTKLSVVLAQFLPVLACAYYYLIDSTVDLVPIGLIALHAMLYMLSGFAVSLLGLAPKVLRIIPVVINLILFFGFSLLFLLAITFGSITVRTAYQGDLSPDGQYMITAIHSDSGALGGGGTVLMIENIGSSIQLGYGRLSQRALIHSDEVDEHKHLSYLWKDDHTLLVNGTVYPLPNP